MKRRKKNKKKTFRLNIGMSQFWSKKECPKTTTTTMTIHEGHMRWRQCLIR